MPGSPYIENPKNLLTWKKVLPWIVLIPPPTDKGTNIFLDVNVTNF